MSERPSGVVGFDVARVEAWLDEHTPVVPPCTWVRLEGGHSNLTYLLTDASGVEYVIRRPPQGELLPKAHDMFREYRIIDGLWPTKVPVAEPIVYADDRELRADLDWASPRYSGLTADHITLKIDGDAQERRAEARMRIGPSEPLRCASAPRGASAQGGHIALTRSFAPVPSQWTLGPTRAGEHHP